MSLTRSVEVWLYGESCTVWSKLDQPSWHIHSLQTLLTSLHFPKPKQSHWTHYEPIHMVQYRLDHNPNMTLIFFSLSFFELCDWWFRGKIALSMLKTMGCPLSPFWMAWYYVGCPAACAEWRKQLSHLLHSIFISPPTSGERRGPKGLQLLSQSPICSTGQV